MAVVGAGSWCMVWRGGEGRVCALVRKKKKYNTVPDVHPRRSSGDEGQRATSVPLFPQTWRTGAGLRVARGVGRQQHPRGTAAARRGRHRRRARGAGGGGGRRPPPPRPWLTAPGSSPPSPRWWWRRPCRSARPLTGEAGLPAPALARVPWPREDSKGGGGAPAAGGAAASAASMPHGPPWLRAGAPPPPPPSPPFPLTSAAYPLHSRRASRSGPAAGRVAALPSRVTFPTAGRACPPRAPPRAARLVVAPPAATR